MIFTVIFILNDHYNNDTIFGDITLEHNFVIKDYDT